MIRPVLHVSEILAAADAFHKRWRRWPTQSAGPVHGVPDLTWCGIDQALRNGNRGLRPGSSLSKFLLKHRGVRNRLLLPALNHAMILRWADAHRARTGRWPRLTSGKVAGAPGETWCGIHQALRAGRRTLRGGSSLARLLAARRGVRNKADMPRLTPKKVLAWADAHFKRTGKWPFAKRSGTIPEAPAETWAAIDDAFVAGTRGLPAYGSLARFLGKRRGVLNRKNLPDLKIHQILAWARAFKQRTGKLPRHISGAIPESHGETWGSVHGALYQGRRGLPKSSLAQLLQRHRNKL